jgi:predicted membrane channel-forming protein YqfA (hemolysin III family)
MIDKLLHDGGWKSRKLMFAAGTSLAIVILALVAGSYMPALIPVLPECYGALLAVLATYSGANFAGKWNVTKYANGPLQPTKPEDPKP